jgi:hypothetical protein
MAALHAPAQRCGEISLNTFEQRNPDEFSADCGDHCDAFAGVQRGAITKAFNVGLVADRRAQQRKELNVDTYNGGCLDVWGCVDSDGFRCAGARDAGFGPFMRAQFDELDAPYDPSGAEYAPPPALQGLKAGTVNSVTGWRRAPGGDYAWRAAACGK